MSGATKLMVIRLWVVVWVVNSGVIITRVDCMATSLCLWQAGDLGPATCSPTQVGLLELVTNRPTSSQGSSYRPEVVAQSEVDMLSPGHPLGWQCLPRLRLPFQQRRPSRPANELPLGSSASCRGRKHTNHQTLHQNHIFQNLAPPVFEEHSREGTADSRDEPLNPDKITCTTLLGKRH